MRREVGEGEWRSLIGARRAVWKVKQLTDGDFFGKDAAIPRLLAPGESRGADEVYHFLVWDEDMAPAGRDKLMKAHWPAECARVAEWQKKQVRKKWTGQEAKLAVALSARIDELWAAYAAERHGALARTACTASVWPTPSESAGARPAERGGGAACAAPAAPPAAPRRRCAPGSPRRGRGAWRGRRRARRGGR